MKRRLLFLLCCFLLLTISVSADTLTVVRSVPIPIEKIQTDPLGNWKCTSLKDSVIQDAIMTYDRSDSTRLSLLLENTAYQYKLVHDSLLCLGYQNALNIMEYTNPQLMAVYPLELGSVARSSFKGVGEYCHLLPIRVNGTSTTKVEGFGSLYLPDSKIDSVFLLHITTEYAEHARMNGSFRTDAYLWLRKGIRFPLMVLKEMRSLDSDTAVSRCMYYSVLEMDDAQAEDDVLLTESTGQSLLTDVRFLPNPVVSDLTIEYNLSAEADVWTSVHNGQGIPMFRSNTKHLPAGEHAERVDMSGYPTSDYVLYLYANDVVVSETIIKL